MKNGEEKGFTAAEFKSAQNDGWEKQYPYKVDKKKVYMTPSAAETQGLVRADKHPKSTRYGRQNPISERWNSEEQLAAMRNKRYPRPHDQQTFSLHWSVLDERTIKRSIPAIQLGNMAALEE